MEDDEIEARISARLRPQLPKKLDPDQAAVVSPFHPSVPLLALSLH